MRRLAPALVALALLAAGCGSDGEDDAARIRVRGSGWVRVPPDLLTVTLGVEARSPQAGAAVDESSRLAGDVLGRIRERGVPDEDVRTSFVSVQPTYTDEGKVDGFVASNLVTVRTRELDAAGELLDSVADVAGDAVRIDGLSFSIEDPASAAEDARADAVRRARRQAEQLAEASDVRLGRLRAVEEVSAGGGGDPYRFAEDSAAGSAASTAGVPLAPGSQEVRVEVELVYEVED